MNQNDLFRIPAIGEGATLGQVLAKETQTSSVSIHGLTGGATGQLLATLALQRHFDCLLVVTVDHATARQTASDLQYHLGSSSMYRVVVFPAYDMGPYDEMVPDRTTAMAQAMALFRLTHPEDKRICLVVAAPDLMRRVIPQSMFVGLCFELVRHMHIEREMLTSQLAQAGYHHCPVVEEPGSYSVKGGVVDVFSPLVDTPVRLEFFGNSLERLWTFSLDTYRRERELEHLWICPVSQLLAPVDARARERAQQRLRDACDAVHMPTNATDLLIGDLLDGRLIVGFHRYMALLHDDLSTVMDYATPSRVFIDDPTGVQIAMKQTESRFRTGYDYCAEEQRVAVSLARTMVDPTSLLKFFDACPVMRSWTLKLDDDGTSLEADFDEESFSNVDVRTTGFSRLRQRLDDLMLSQGTDALLEFLADYVNRLTENGYRVVMVSHTDGQRERLREMLSHRQLDPHCVTDTPVAAPPGVYLTVGELTQGHIWPGEGMCFIAEEEIFGKRRRSGTGTGRHRKSMFDLHHLQIGDLVVHRDHGVGRYLGLVTREYNSVATDFVLLAYRDQDKLYLPVYRLETLQKYRSVTDSKVVLDKMGGQTFLRTKARAQKNAMELAAKLLDTYARKSLARRPPVEPIDDLYRTFEASFPFEETQEQSGAIDDVMRDLQEDRPMDRLICGDVGFGKTEVALRAAFRVVNSGRQVAVLVPTTVLAQQHFESFKRRFAPYPVTVDMLSRFRSATQNRQTVADLKLGRIDVVIGTHRVLSRDVHFCNLGLLVVDEEHRFGVTHKERLRALRASVDTLSMTATPIPRTLHMAFSRLRDLSIISTPPVNRLPVKTLICHDDGAMIKGAIERELARNGQVFFLHNRVRQIQQTAQRIRRLVPFSRVAVGHGQMREAELETVMKEFVAGRYDVLVSTAIIESGLDIAAANTIFIDRADTLGLAQLYQLRGRVGRSDRQAYAYLLVPPLEMLSHRGKQRLEALVRHNDLGSGFQVASMDLEIRGAGDLLGDKQSGDVAGIGFELYMELLDEACARLKGEAPQTPILTEVTLADPGVLPADFIGDDRIRLHYYKELTAARSETEVQTIGAALQDRFGTLPAEVHVLLEGMIAKALCQSIRAVGLDVTPRRITIHLNSDSPLDPRQITTLIEQSEGTLRLTPDFKLILTNTRDRPFTTTAAISFVRRLQTCIPPALCHPQT